MDKNKNKKMKKEIICDVSNCVYNDDCCCLLDSVKITSFNDKCKTCDDTICQSFTTTSSNINDNVYEVESDN